MVMSPCYPGSSVKCIMARNKLCSKVSHLVVPMNGGGGAERQGGGGEGIGEEVSEEGARDKYLFQGQANTHKYEIK